MAKAKQFKATPAPSVAGKGPLYAISRAELVAFVAGRVPRDGLDDDATLRNKVSSKVTYDVPSKLCRLASGRFQLGAVAEWAAKEYPGLFDDLPRFSRRVYGRASAGGGARTLARGVQQPGTLAESHEKLAESHEKIVALEMETAALRVRVAENTWQRRGAPLTARRAIEPTDRAWPQSRRDEVESQRLAGMTLAQIAKAQRAPKSTISSIIEQRMADERERQGLEAAKAGLSGQRAASRKR